MSARVVRGLEIAGAATLWMLLIVGVSLALLTLPVYTSTAVQALGVPTSSGLPVSDTLFLANAVRASVADIAAEELPALWKGRAAFDERAVEHLRDVRDVLGAARAATGIVAGLLAVWIGVCVARKRFSVLRAGMLWGGGLTVGVLVVLGLAGSTDFSSFFTGFHGVFFDSGTWLFDADSLLIRLFPERFWVYSGVAWAVLCVVGAALLAGSARFVPGADGRSAASREGENV